MPDSVIGPIVDVLIGTYLDVQPADFRSSHAEQGEAALMIGIDQFV
jgi:hypothetical protein